MDTLGKRLKELRKKRGWTLKQVATKLGLKGHSTYSNWEYDRTEPDVEMINKLSSIYDVPVDYLVGKKQTKINFNEYDDAEFVDPFIIFDLVEQKTDDEIIKEFRHQAAGKDIDENTVRSHLQYIRFLLSQKKK